MMIASKSLSVTLRRLMDDIVRGVKAHLPSCTRGTRQTPSISSWGQHINWEFLGKVLVKNYVDFIWTIILRKVKETQPI